MLFQGAQELRFSGELISSDICSEKVPGVAAQPWQLVARAEGPRPRRPH